MLDYTNACNTLISTYLKGHNHALDYIREALVYTLSAIKDNPTIVKENDGFKIKPSNIDNLHFYYNQDAGYIYIWYKSRDEETRIAIDNDSINHHYFESSGETIGLRYALPSDDKSKFYQALKETLFILIPDEMVG